MDSQRNRARDKGTDRMRANKSYIKKASPLSRLLGSKGKDAIGTNGW